MNKRAGLWMAAALASVLLRGSMLVSNVDAATLYAADGAQGNLSNLYTLDPATGVVSTTIGPIGFAITGLAIDPGTGLLYGTTSSQDPTATAAHDGFLILINKLTGPESWSGRVRTGSSTSSGSVSMADLTFDPAGSLYGWCDCTDDLYLIDKVTGTGVESGIRGQRVRLRPGVELAGLCIAGNGASGALRTWTRRTGSPLSSPPLAVPIARRGDLTRSHSTKPTFCSGSTTTLRLRLRHNS